METIMMHSWYGIEDAARALEVPVEQVRALYKDVLAGVYGQIAISYYGGATKPAIQGNDLRRLAGCFCQ